MDNSDTPVELPWYIQLLIVLGQLLTIIANVFVLCAVITFWAIAIPIGICWAVLSGLTNSSRRCRRW